MKIDGMADLQQAINRLGALPQKVVTPAAKKGAAIFHKATKVNAPVDTGVLKQAIILKPEKSRKKGKKVYQVTYSSAYNDLLVKTSKDGKRSYYPASQEYGYMTKNGNYIPGYHFMRDAAVENSAAAEKTIITEMTKRLDKEWRKKSG
jgi:HK97 gp10 family phage protein